jgi:hypothetical protein
MSISSKIAVSVQEAAIALLLEDLLADEQATDVLKQRAISKAGVILSDELGKLPLAQKVLALQEIPELEKIEIYFDYSVGEITADEVISEILSVHLVQVLKPLYGVFSKAGFTVSDLRAVTFAVA